MSKKCQELISRGSAVKGRDVTTKCGWRTGGRSVLGMPSLLGDFLYPPPLLPSFLGTRGPALPACLVVVALVYQTEYISFSSLKLLFSHSLTLMSTILY